MSPEQAASALERFGGALDVASVNSPFSTTISGDAAALAELGVELENRNVLFRVLELEYPFHSHLLDDLREPLLRQLQGLRPGCSRSLFVSTTTGSMLGGEELECLEAEDVEGRVVEALRRRQPEAPCQSPLPSAN